MMRTYVPHCYLTVYHSCSENILIQDRSQQGRSGLKGSETMMTVAPPPPHPFLTSFLLAIVPCMALHYMTLCSTQAVAPMIAI